MAQRDSEQFDQMLFVFERLGTFLNKRAGALSDYREHLMALASESYFGRALPADSRQWHSDVTTLYSMVQEGRNDALHHGARARHLTDHVIEFGLILEDALVNSCKPIRKAIDVMVPSPVIAHDWQPLSFVRQTMLTDSFSFLPIFWDGDWQLVRDRDVAHFLQIVGPNGWGRDKKLGCTVREAVDAGMPLCLAAKVAADTAIDELLSEDTDRPLLVVERGEPAIPDRLIGIIAAFDLL